MKLKLHQLKTTGKTANCMSAFMSCIIEILFSKYDRHGTTLTKLLAFETKSRVFGKFEVPRRPQERQHPQLLGPFWSSW